MRSGLGVRGAISLLLTLSLLVAGCGSGGSDETAVAESSAKESGKPPAGGPSGPAVRVTECLVEAGGSRGPLAPNPPEPEPPSRWFAHGYGPGEGHVAIYLFTSPKRIDRLVRGFDEIGEYDALKTMDGRALILLDPGYDEVDRATAFRCASSEIG